MLILLIIGFVISVAFTAMSIAIRSLSLPYLKYWAQKGDRTSGKLYPLKAEGSSVLLTIEIFRALALSGTIILFASGLWSLAAWLAAAVVLFLVFIVLSELYLKPVGTYLLASLSAPILSTTRLLKFITEPLGRVFDKFIEETPVTLTRAELTHMINTVQSQDTDLSADEIRILKHAINFGYRTVHDVMTPKSVIESVKEHDVISPILLDELHKSGHSRFPVYSSDDDAVTGILYIKDLLDVKISKQVSQLMHSPVHYVNEDRELDHVLQAFIKTKQHMFMVVNGFAEITGLVTIEDVIEQVLGKPIIDEFDKYDNMRDVAEAKAKIVKKQVKMVE